MAQKTIVVKTLGEKYVVQPKAAYLKAMQSAKDTDDVVTLKGIQIQAGSAELYSNGPEAIETVNNSNTANELVVDTVSNNPLSTPPVPTIGDSLDIEILKDNEGEVTIAVGALPPAALLEDGVPLAAGKLEAGYTVRVIKTVAGYALTTNATIAAAKATATKIELATKVNGTGVDGFFTSNDGKLVEVINGVITAITPV